MTDIYNPQTWPRRSDEIARLDQMVDDAEWESIPCEDLRDHRGRFVAAMEVEGDLIPPF